MQFTKLTPIVGLLTGATVWGLIWYPYRALEQAGIAGDLAATLSYAIALLLGCAAFWRRLAWRQITLPLVLIGLSTGWANVAFTYAVIYGEVMRVVLLFYLAPLWTVLFARVLLGEKLTSPGYVLMALALSGAAVMLWDPRMGLPLPRALAEWIGLSSGLMFALSNVLARRYAGIAIEAKVLAVLAGGVAVGICSIALTASAPPAWDAVLAQSGLLILISVALCSVNFAVQFALAVVSANRAIVIYLFELVVTAFAAWLLAGETLTLKDWCGGAMIIAAGLSSERIARPAAPAAHQD